MSNKPGKPEFNYMMTICECTLEYLDGLSSGWKESPVSEFIKSNIDVMNVWLQDTPLAMVLYPDDLDPRLRKLRSGLEAMMTGMD